MRAIYKILIGTITLLLALPLSVGAVYKQGWMYTTGGTNFLNSSTSPTVNYITATSTSATSTFSWGIQANLLNIISTISSSTFANGINLTKGCFAINGSCVGGSSGAGTVTSVTGTWPIISSEGNTPNLTWGGLASSSAIAAGAAVLYSTGVNTFASAATGTVLAGAGITVTSAQSIIGSGLTITSTLGTSVDLTSEITGTLPVGNGGTGVAMFGQGWLHSSGGTTAITSSTSPTVNYITATSTTATSTFAHPISATYASTTATSTMKGINLPYGGCLAIAGTCLTSSSGSGTVNSGTAKHVAYYRSTGTTVEGTSTMTFSNVGTQTTIDFRDSLGTISNELQNINGGASTWFFGSDGELTFSASPSSGGTWSILGQDAVGNASLFLDSNNPSYINNGKNFGIGTTSPYSTLSVVGQVVARNFVATSTTATSTFAAPIILSSTGTNPIVGNAILVGGTKTVTTGAATANSFVFLTRKTSGGTIGTAITYTITSGSFTINSDNPLDTSTFTWIIIN